MQIALECPTSMLEEMQPLGDFDWALAHLVLKDKAYADFYKASTRFKVLDNSVNELLRPCSLEDLKRAADIVWPDKIVAPDFLGDSRFTLDMLDKAIAEFGSYRIIPVVQGVILDEVQVCAREIAARGFSEVAIPYDIMLGRDWAPAGMAEARAKVVEFVVQGGFLRIHLLGLTTLSELLSYRGLDKVCSIDTGFPVLQGLRQRKIGLDSEYSKAVPTMNSMETIDQASLTPEVYYNIAMLRKVTNGH